MRESLVQKALSSRGPTDNCSGNSLVTRAMNPTKKLSAFKYSTNAWSELNLVLKLVRFEYPLNLRGFDDVFGVCEFVFQTVRLLPWVECSQSPGSVGSLHRRSEGNAECAL